MAQPGVRFQGSTQCLHPTVAVLYRTCLSAARSCVGLAYLLSCDAVKQALVSAFEHLTRPELPSEVTVCWVQVKVIIRVRAPQ